MFIHRRLPSMMFLKQEQKNMYHFITQLHTKVNVARKRHYTFQYANNKGAEQTARMHRLVLCCSQSAKKVS